MVTDGIKIAEVRKIIEDEEARLRTMRRMGVSNERIASLSHEIDAWKRRLRNLEVARA